MKNVTRTICLTLALFLGSVGTGCGPDFNKGVAAYESGDFATALGEFRPLAEQGDADAQYNLGVMYEKGRGVPQDDKIALKWFTLSAEQGYARAQNNLGVMYYNGEGVIKDNVYAHMWGNIAASNGLEKAVEFRDWVGEKMTPSQLETSQRIAGECVRKQYKGC